MINIVVFGKPNSYESYEYEFDGESFQNKENTHLEPAIKPQNFNDIVLHYYSKDGIIGCELYTRCYGYSSERQGIIFGVGLKSDHDFEIIEAIEKLLKPFWSDLASVFLDSSNKYISPSIVNSLKNTQWSDDEIQLVTSIKKNVEAPKAKYHDGILLLVASEMSKINDVESKIKEFSDVYIVSNAEVFKEPNNQSVLNKQAGDKIFQIEDKTIKQISGAQSPSDGKKKLPQWDKGGSSKQPFTTNGDDKTGGETGGTIGNGGGSVKHPYDWKKIMTRVGLAAAIILVACLIFKPFIHKQGEQKDTIVLSPSQDINKELIICNNNKESYTWEIEGSGKNYVEIDQTGQKVIIKLIQQPNKDKDITITVKSGSTQIGQQSYKIRKKELPKANKCTFRNYDEPINECLDLTPQLSFNGDANVSTQLSEIKFEVDCNDLVSIKDRKLLVNKSPDTDTKITVTAKLNGMEIGSQIYTIKAQDSSRTIPDPDKKTGKIYCYKKTDPNTLKNPATLSFTNRSIAQYCFIVKDENDNKFSDGQWGFNLGIICINQTTNNPTTITFDDNKKKGYTATKQTIEVYYKVQDQKIATTQITLTWD